MKNMGIYKHTDYSTEVERAIFAPRFCEYCGKEYLIKERLKTRGESRSYDRKYSSSHAGEAYMNAMQEMYKFARDMKMNLRQVLVGKEKIFHNN